MDDERIRELLEEYSSDESCPSGLDIDEEELISQRSDESDTEEEFSNLLEPETTSSPATVTCPEEDNNSSIDRPYASSTRLERKQTDRLAPIRSLHDKFVLHCQENYDPSEYLTIDEKLDSFRGRCVFVQYMPNKPAKYGLKSYLLVDAKSFHIVNLELYAGTQPPGPYNKSNKPLDVVDKLVQPISQSSRNITFDNWFTSYPLTQHLLSHYKLTSVGTIRKNKREIPASISNARGRDIHSSEFIFQKDTTLVSYVPKKNKVVLVISTMHHDNSIDVMTGGKRKPEMITFYNRTKGGVNVVDELCANYDVSRNSKRWPLTFFYSLLNMAGINSYIIRKENCSLPNLKRREFLRVLGLKLVENHWSAYKST
ncbi:piggyBac transposable element-derived protein 4-like [Melitaea cinxia]|uniref:piggyBac transposable element-derived protein 4-like n=1 Tax=Melitaea cinxia TaxID=113334 RepID=UPI001E270432|nr:piggyBac transposable element-derived protein 4-like [Melitaea cinxia]